MRLHHSLLILLSALSAPALAGPAGPAGEPSPVIERPTRAASALPDGPIGYSPAHRDRSVDPRQDFYRYAAGRWLGRPPDDPGGGVRKTVQAISVQMFSPLARHYVQAHFSDAMRQDIATMVGHIKNEFAIRLRANPWLDGPTRAAALDKLARVDIQVGYPRQWIDDSGLDIRADDFVGNNRRIAAFNFRRELAKVGVPVVAERFADARYTSPIAVNASYNPSMNGIDITAAIAQPPFYQPGGDIAVNYCTVGAVIGHELTHGFDSNGRQYDATGNVRLVDGLSADQRCFVAWSQLWIYKAREERIRLLAATDYHAIGFVRATQPLLNLDAFHQAFGTRPGDAMWRAPSQRVRIW